MLVPASAVQRVSTIDGYAHESITVTTSQDRTKKGKIEVILGDVGPQTEGKVTEVTTQGPETGRQSQSG
jgi:hypothetical protein